MLPHWGSIKYGQSVLRMDSNNGDKAGWRQIRRGESGSNATDKLATGHVGNRFDNWQTQSQSVNACVGYLSPDRSLKGRLAAGRSVCVPQHTNDTPGAAGPGQLPDVFVIHRKSFPGYIAASGTQASG